MRKKRIGASLALFILMCMVCFGQDARDAREVIRALSAPEMRGRGYFRHGDRRASEYIAKRFGRNGLNKFKKGYFQGFKFPVNVIQRKLVLSLDGTRLDAGRDFLVDPASPAVDGIFEVVGIQRRDLLVDTALYRTLASCTGKFLLIDTLGYAQENPGERKRIKRIFEFLKTAEDNPSVGTILLTPERLTWGVAKKQVAKPFLRVDVNVVRQPVEQVYIIVNGRQIHNYKTRNVVAWTEGKSVRDSFIVFTAHYDHLGMMGNDVYFPGANDNASGVAMLLDLAAHFAVPGHEPEYSMVFIATAAEEAGFAGSSYFVKNPPFDLDHIKFLINLDLVGTGEQGIMVVNGKTQYDEFKMLRRFNEKHRFLPGIKSRGAACISDHCPFQKKGVPSIFIYTLGEREAYHDIYDRPGTLTLAGYEGLFRLLTTFVDRL